MKRRYLLDTDICIYLIKRSYPCLLEKLNTLTTDEVAISIITAGELRYGARKSRHSEKNLAVLDELFRIAEPLPISSEVTHDYGEIRAALEKQGISIGNNDLWIAAHARSLNLTLVTNNLKEFSRVPSLRVENWIV